MAKQRTEFVGSGLEPETLTDSEGFAMLARADGSGRQMTGNGRRFIPGWLAAERLHFMVDGNGSSIGSVNRTSNDRQYHCHGYVCLDKDPTILVMVRPFERANMAEVAP